MPAVPVDQLAALDLEYARFNAERTVGDPRPSAFAELGVGPLTVTVDPARDGTYYNRVLGLDRRSVAWLDRALAHFEGRGPAPRIDVDERDLAHLEAPLAERGFEAFGGLVWLSCRAVTRTTALRVRRLGSAETDLLLPFLEVAGPVDPELWAERRRHYCTRRFRVFVIEVDGEPVSMATTYIGENGALLGNAFTFEGWRGRGFHQALIAARLADAHELGLDRVVTDVEPRTASLRNCERAGFEPLLRQSIWERVAKEDA